MPKGLLSSAFVGVRMVWEWWMFVETAAMVVAGVARAGPSRSCGSGAAVPVLLVVVVAPVGSAVVG